MRTIRELRTKRGWRQQDLAQHLRVTPSTVYNWERGAHLPTILQLRAMAELFDVSVDEIALVGVDVDREGQPLKTAA